MMDVEEFERSLLESARKGLGATASDRMRVQSRLVGHAAWWQAAPERLSLLQGFKRSWKGGLALGFAVGALIGFGASRGLEAVARRGGPESSQLRPAASSAAALSPAAPSLELQQELSPALGGAEPALAEPVAEAAVQTAGALLEAPAVGARGQRGSAPARAAASSARADSAEEGGSTLARELAMLQRARRALNRSDAQLALGIVESLDERFPDGVLMEERVATRILSLCQLERTEEAREQGQRFLSAHPRSVYAERVRHSCAGQR